MSVFGKAGRRGRTRDRNRTTRPFVELFEDRTLLSTFTVTDTSDNGDNTNPTVNTLRWAVQQAELPDNAGSTIDFNITTGTGPFVINLNTTPLLPISQATTIDGTSQPGFSTGPIVVISGSALSSGSGLDLTADGSTIKGLDIVGFTGAGATGIDVASSNNVIQSNYIGVGPNGSTAGPGNAAGLLISGSNNTIGGTGGAANTIAFNTGDAVHVTSGSGNVIRQDLIFANGGDIVLDAGTNNNQAAPTVVAVASVPNLTTIDYQVTGTVGQVYTIDFYASGTLGGPAAQLIGSFTTNALTSATQAFTQTFALATPLAAGEKVTATATSAANDTSGFATSTTLASSFQVTNKTDNVPGSVVGSLRQAIVDANLSPAAGQTDVITFAIPGSSPFVISPTAVLPTIGVPVTIDGTSQAGVEINGGGQSFDGLILGAGSGGSTITGLTIADFIGNGINVQSDGNAITGDRIGTGTTGQAAGPGNRTGIAISGSNNTVGGTTASAANTIGFNTQAGVSVLSGTANAIRENSYVGTNGPASPAGDINVAAGANNNQPAPVIAGVLSSNNQLVVHIAENVPDGTSTTFDIYHVDTTSSPPGRVFLGTQTVTVTSGSAVVQIAAPGIKDTDLIAATATVTANGTSAFSNAQTGGNPLIVTNTSDDALNPAPGSLRAALIAANKTQGSVISFDIAGPGPSFTITLQAALPAIIFPTTIDATTQPGFSGKPLVTIDGNNLAADGLTLGQFSGGSAIRGLEIAHFHGAGILVQSNNNTIGGSVAGAGNKIDNNTGAAINVSPVIGGSPPTGNAIRQNLIFANGDGIFLSSGANHDQAAPTVVAATSVTNPTTNISLTTIDFQMNATAGPYAIDFFASSDLGSPPAEFLGSLPITLATTGITQGFTATFTTLVAAGQKVTATATSAGNDTSEFATSVSLASPYLVTNKTDGVLGSEVGSLRQAILNANGSGPGQTYHITFAIPPASAPFTITIQTGIALPAIVVPVTIDGTTQAGVEVNGGNQGFNGFTLGAGSDGSTIEGLTIVNFDGSGIAIQSSNNTIGGTVASAANTIGSNAAGGVAILSGTGNAVRRNEYTGSNGSLTPVEANDITLNPAANNNPPAPRILGAVFTPGGTTMIVSVQFTFPTAIPAHDPNNPNGSYHASLDFYQILPSGSRQYLSPTTPDPVEILPSTGDPKVSQTINVTVPVPAAFTQQTFVIATATFTGGSDSTSPPASGTSVFSNEVNSTSPTIVYTTADTSSGSPIAGSLRFAIGFANANHNSTITFAIPGTGPLFVINLAAALPTIFQPTTIDGTSQQGYAPGLPVVEINGMLVASGSGLDLAANNCTIEGLGLVNFNKGTGAAGITIEPGTTGNAVRGNLIGTDHAGNKLGNTDGIDIYGSGNIIGGSTPFTTPSLPNTNISPANTVGFNTGSGIAIIANTIGASVSANIVQGNYIGTDILPDGTYGNRGNFGVGILIEADDERFSAVGAASASGNIIGGVIAAAANSIGFNGGAGVEISILSKANSGLNNSLSAANNLVEGNMIGGFSTGTSSSNVPFPNIGPGVWIAAKLTPAAATGTVANADLSGNVIGWSPSNPIGGTGPTTSAITSPGVVNSLGTARNYILDNASEGILIDLSRVGAGDAVANTVQGNLISRNQSDGVHWIGDLSGDVSVGEISNNFIGTDPTGSVTYSPTGAPWGNVLSGVLLEQSATASGALVAASVTGNVISGNGLSGVTVDRYSNPTPAPSPSPTARVAIAGNIMGLDKTGAQAIVFNTTGGSTGGVALPMGNVLDGVLLDNVVGVIVGSTLTSGVPTTPSNVLSGNLGRGIEARGDSLSSSPPTVNTIEGNFIGTDISGTLAVNKPIGATNDYNLGNLSDGVFLFVPSGTTIADNLISNNRAAGIHAAAQAGVNQTTGQLVIEGNHIGTDATGESVSDANNTKVSLGNGSDGVFIDSITSHVTIGTTAGAANVISGNRANGIDLLDSIGIAVAGNMIGTDASGTRSVDLENSAFGNSSNGIFLNGSSSVSVGAVSIGGSVVAAGNVISGNLYAGILLANKALNNTISNNKIGTDLSGMARLGNSADGIFLLAGQATIGATVSNGSPVTGTNISGNTISGNFENGVQIFGPGASNNTVSNNMIGVGSDGHTPVVNGANGVYLNDDAGGNIIGPTNVISGNAQSGVLIFGTEFKGGHDSVVANMIGADSTGSYAVPNGGNGVFIYGAPSNIIGGTTENPGPGGGIGNLISGNAQAGVSIFSPAETAFADSNLVAGNLIGTDMQGTAAIPNQADGVDIYSARNNTIGASGGLNVISGNRANGILITKLSNVDSTGNLVNRNYIGTNANGTSVLPNGNDGVLVQNAYGNTIGGASSGLIANVKAPTSPSNVISGNGASGIEFSDFAEDMPGNAVHGNFIGVSKDGTGSLGNGLAGVFVNNLSSNVSSKETIGGTATGTGNIIAGSASGYGISIVGPVTDSTPASNFVQGNLIGLDLNGNAVNNNSASPASTDIGIYLQNSSGNTIGGSADARNVISANTRAGIELTGLYSTRNVIRYNEIGTTLDGKGRPGSSQSVTSVTSPTQDATSPLQFYGIYITAPSPTFDRNSKLPNNQILNNQISGNMMGIDITGVGSGTNTTGQGVPFGRNIIAGNLIGTDLTGNAANPNFEYGVYIDNSAGNTVGGTEAGAGNLISANGVDGVEIFGGTPQTKPGPTKSGAPAARNMIIGNTIGYNSAGGPGFTAGGGASVNVPDGPLVTLGQQLHGVVVIGSSSNIIGGKKQGNLIGGNVSTGVYITVQDFNGNIYSTPTNNTVSFNTIVNNGQYGVYRFESPRNSVARIKFAGNPINLADFLKNVGVNTLPAPKSRFAHKPHSKHAKTSHARHPEARAHKQGHGKLTAPARPRIPALFHPGVKTIRIDHVPARRHR